MCLMHMCLFLLLFVPDQTPCEGKASGVGGTHRWRDTQPAAPPCGVHCSLHSESSSSHICLSLVCLPQEAFQCILLAYASKGVLSLGFTQSQYYEFHHGLAQALVLHCISLQGLAGGWSPSVFQGLVLSSTSWELNPRVWREPINSTFVLVFSSVNWR